MIQACLCVFFLHGVLALRMTSRGESVISLPSFYLMASEFEIGLAFATDGSATGIFLEALLHRRFFTLLLFLHFGVVEIEHALRVLYH